MSLPHISKIHRKKNDKTLNGASVSTEMNAVFIIALKTLCYIISQCFLTHIVKSCAEFEILPQLQKTSEAFQVARMLEESTRLLVQRQRTLLLRPSKQHEIHVPNPRVTWRSPVGCGAESEIHHSWETLRLGNLELLKRGTPVTLPKHCVTVS